MQNVQTPHDEHLELEQAQTPTTSSTLLKAAASSTKPSKSASLEAIHSELETKPKVKSRSRFSTAIRKLSGSTRKKEQTVKETTQDTVISSGGEEPEPTPITLADTEEKSKKKVKLSKRFLLSSLSKKSKISPKTSIDADDDNDERNAALNELDASATKAQQSPKQQLKKPNLKKKTKTKIASNEGKIPKQSKVKITISGKKIESPKIDIASAATEVTGSTSEADYLTPSEETTALKQTKAKSTVLKAVKKAESAAKAKKKLKSKTTTTTVAATDTATTVSSTSSSSIQAKPRESAEKLVITQSIRDTPPSERAPLKPSRSASVSSAFSQTTADNETSTVANKSVKRPTATDISPSLAQRFIESATKAKKQRANTIIAGEAELMQDSHGSLVQRGHRFPQPSTTTTSTTTPTPLSIQSSTTTPAVTRQQQLQFQFKSQSQTKPHASQSLPPESENVAVSSQQLKPPAYPPPPVPNSPALTPETRSTAHNTDRQQLEVATTRTEKSVVTTSNSGQDDFVSSAESSAYHEDYDISAISQDLLDKAAEAALRIAAGSLRKQASYGSNRSSGSESPISDSSRKRIHYISKPIVYDDFERVRKRKDDFSLQIEATEHAYDTNNEIVENQMPAFGDLTMDEEMEPTIMTSANAEKREHLYKILVIGELGTGKTSFIKRYVHQFFSQNYRATIGVDFALKVLHWDSNTIVRLQLWDIAGQERFGNMTRVYYKEAVGAFIVFDVTRSGTFDCVSKWKEDLDSKVQLPDGSPIPCILLANKCDQEKQGIVTQPEKMDDYVRENGFAGWFETSAKENINIDEAARALVSKILLNDKMISASDLADSARFNLNTTDDQIDGDGKKCSC